MLLHTSWKFHKFWKFLATAPSSVNNLSVLHTITYCHLFSAFEVVDFPAYHILSLLLVDFQIKITSIVFCGICTTSDTISPNIIPKATI